mmetsp:Transcript_13584/g.49404  ORF Transcript_13584/g.49404 Transcript_13584/m.49404 type:complete len:112 (+) Transcript_13584:221-556(+)
MSSAPRSLTQTLTFGLTSGFGMLLLVHSGAIYRQEIESTDEPGEEAPLPLTVLVELLVGTLLCVFGSIQLAGDFHPIKADAVDRREMGFFDSEFQSFGHRGRCVPVVPQGG